MKFFFRIYYVVNTLLFPFAALVWNELKRLVMGDLFIVMDLKLLLGIKFVITCLLWMLAIFIAPLGILYIWLRARYAGQN